MRVMVLSAVALTTAQAWGADCNRDCLRGMTTQFLNALVAHKPEALPLAAGLRYTEDTQVVPVGAGLWKTATAVRPYRQDILDVAQGVAGVHAVVEESGKPVMLLARLKVAAGKITEMETQITRSRDQGGGIFEVEELKSATQPMNAKPAKTVSREEMIRAAVHYPRGLKAGSFVTVDAPFAADAYRFENGRLMAGKGCAFRPPSCEDIKGQQLRPSTTITYRVAAVDEEQGIVWLRMNFGVRRAPAAGVTPDELIVWEAFKVPDGQIHAVEAFMRATPAGSGSGWDDVYPPVTPEGPSALGKRVIRIYNDEKGESHIQELVIATKPGTATRGATDIPGASMIYREYVSSATEDWHRAPAKQFSISMSGEIEVEVSDGTKQAIHPGDMVYLEDMNGKGHITRLLSPVTNVFVRLPDTFDVIAWTRGRN